MTRKTRCGLAVLLLAAFFGVSLICTGFAPDKQVLAAEETSKVLSTEELNKFPHILKNTQKRKQNLFSFNVFAQANNGIFSILRDMYENTLDDVVSPEFINVAMTTLTGDDYLNIRAEANAESEVLGKLHPGDGAKVLERGKEWTYITSGSVTGWVKNEYIVTNLEAEKLAHKICPLFATVDADGLMVREEMDRNSGVLTVIYRDATYKVVEDLGEWVKIEYAAGKTGYVSADYVSVDAKLGEAISIEEELEQIRLQKEAEEAARKAKEEAERKAREEAERKAKEEEERKAKEEAAKREEQAKPTTQPAMAATPEELYLLACICKVEAGNYEGMLAVANVVINRVNSTRFPNTITEVIYQPNQFAISYLDKYLTGGPGDVAIKAATDALAGNNLVGDYLFFRSLKKAELTEYARYTIVGGNCFYEKFKK